METTNENGRLDLVHRTIALGLAFATTSVIATSVAVIFTGNSYAAGAAVARVAVASLRAVVGG